MLIREILEVKGRQVVTCKPQETLSEVVDRLVAHNCGSLLVCDTAGSLVGIITERDILRASASVRGSLEGILVEQRMTPSPIVASPNDSVADTMGTMTDKRIRHLPVMDQGRLVGLISIGDIVKAQHDELCRENHYLKNYLQSG